MNTKTFLLACAVSALGVAYAQNSTRPVDVISIDLQSRGDRVYPTMYGAFFEEISHAGDGGLYAEMIQNRGFEEGVIPSGCTLENGEVWASRRPCYTTGTPNNWHIRWDAGRKAMQAWTVDGDHTITADRPLNPATPHSLQITLNGKPVTLSNQGYWGMAVKAGEKYDLRFFTDVRSMKKMKVTVAVVDENGNATRPKSFRCSPKARWQEHRAVLKATRSTKNARLELRFENEGTVNIDYVSLFPQATYNKRKNGLRADIAQMLVDMKPSFLRWPGGCILEGINIDNAVDWKKTLGDPVLRPGEYDLWGYRNSYGFGYHEFLEFCEEAGIDPMYVCNAGMSCLFRGGDYVEGDSLQLMIKDCLNAIEYAIGDETATFWGRQRALNGHPKPFPLRYIEIGNENVGPRYAAHYKFFRDAIRDKYPQLEIICALMFHPETSECGDMDYFDPHYYENTDWFFRATDIFDSIPEQYAANIYIGEYAAGGADMYASLAEAAFLLGCERNGERVRMTSFAPLFQNTRNAGRHMICYDNSMVFGRSNYYMVKAMNENRPDYNLTTDIKKNMMVMRAGVADGRVGLSTFGNDVEFSDFTLTQYGADNDETDVFCSSDPSSDTAHWTEEHDGSNRFLWLDRRIGGRYDITFRMKKNSGKEACRVMFGGKDTKNFFMAELGSHQNESTIFGERRNGDYTNYFRYRNVESIEQGRWYDVSVKVDGCRWQIFLDGRCVESYEYDAGLIRHYAQAGMDDKKGEIILKIVNGENQSWPFTLDIINGRHDGITQVERTTISADSPKAENTIAHPTLITPIKDHITLTLPNPRLTVPANSMTILRIKK